MIKTKKAQAGLEFLLVFSILTIFATMFFIMIFSNTSQGRTKNDQEVTEDMANFLQQELILAEKVEDGYHRNFTLPEKISGKEYDVMTSGYSLTVNTSKVTSHRGIPRTAGNFITGSENIIIKNGTLPNIFINLQ